MKKMHVLQLGPYPPPEGGVTRNLLAIRDALAADGHSCTIIATTKGSPVAGESNVYRPRSPFALLRLLRSLRYDLVHLHVGGEISSRVLAMAFAATLFGRGPAVLTIHSGAYPETPEAKAATASSWRGMIFRRFAHIVVVNEALADVFRRYGVRGERLSVILPYVLSAPDETVEVRADLREFLEAHSPVLLAVGGLEPVYDPLFQIAAMKQILARNPNAGLVIVGDGSMRDEVEKAATTSGYQTKIRIAGNVDHAETLHLIRDADVFIRTTLFDGDAISIREALYLGTPVVATENGMRPDGVKLIPKGDTAALVDAVESALSENSAGTQSKVSGENANIREVLNIYTNCCKLVDGSKAQQVN